MAGVVDVAVGPGGVDVAAARQHLVEGALAVGAVAPALVPLGAHQAGAAEQAVHPRPVAPGPEAQAGAQGQVGGAVVAAVVAGVAPPQALERGPVRGAAGPVEERVVAETRWRRLGLGGAGRVRTAGRAVAGQDGVQPGQGRGAGENRGGRARQVPAGDGEEPPPVVQLDGAARSAGGAGHRPLAPPGRQRPLGQDVHARAGGRRLRVAVQRLDDGPGPGSELERDGVEAAVQVGAADGVVVLDRGRGAEHVPDAVGPGRPGVGDGLRQGAPGGGVVGGRLAPVLGVGARMVGDLRPLAPLRQPHRAVGDPAGAPSEGRQGRQVGERGGQRRLRREPGRCRRR